MEIEAKFVIPDTDTFQRLQAAQHIAGFALSAHQVQQMRDTYLDTPEQLIRAAGYSCRRRELEGEVLITLKGLRESEGAVHRREEVEISLPAYVPPSQWPDSAVRDRVLQMIGGAPLVPLFELQQTRVFRRMSQGELRVAELSIDQVHVAVGEREQDYFELEVELAPQGTEDDLGAIVTNLQDEWNLEPELRSKFEQAQELLDEGLAGEGLLASEERAMCVHIARRDDLYGRRARGLLALNEGLSQTEVAERVDRSARTVRRWLAAFRDEGLECFPSGVLGEVEAAPAAEAAEPQQQEAPSLPQPQPLDVLLKQYAVDQAHARAVADHALALFDSLSPVHGLRQGRRDLLETAALVHNIGLETDPRAHHKAGRDILLTHPPEELDDAERLIVALTTFLHRKRMSPGKLDKKLAQDAFVDLPEPMQDEALVLAALVRIADGLDYSQTDSSRLDRFDQGEGLVRIEVGGPYAIIDADRAQQKSDLWHLLFETRLEFGAVGTEAPLDREPQEAVLQGPIATEIEALPDELPEYPGLVVDDTMTQAARKTLVFHFQRMLYHEPGTRLGEDIEELHDMRVATRRMRAAFRVFRDYLDMKELKPIFKGLRRTGRRLGAVRDLDVFWEKTQRYLDGLESERRGDLDPLREAWEAEHRSSRERLLAYLNSDRYTQFKERFAEFLQTPGAATVPTLTKKEEAVPHRLRHVVPMVVYERLAEVQAYDEWVSRPDVSLEQLHRLRIAAKRLRYTLEFFEEVLAPQTRDLIKEMKNLQDHLGDLQDAVVASELLRDFLTWGTWGSGSKKKAPLPSEPVVAPGVATYMADKQTELQHLLETFPEVWAYFQSPEFKQTVAVVVAPL